MATWCHDKFIDCGYYPLTVPALDQFIGRCDDSFGKYILKSYSEKLFLRPLWASRGFACSESGGREVGVSLSSLQLAPATSGASERSTREAQTSVVETAVPGVLKTS
jgi:hypothetical protein